MKFENLNIFKEDVRNYTVYYERDIKWLKNDKGAELYASMKNGNQ